ncbi:hypothetical protein R2Q81_07065 [Microbacterium aquimaris]|uniref:hypothetical protein n=1 Tax=Microbacterium aquimaris TaxID=459816 RepID=UPI002AD32666|nr:hypothetical protein [Microbacterium aquimaris]MDZ8275709.1 hypothetical protein [Microbacterium aquimaris]
MTHSSRGYRTLPPSAAHADRWTVAVEDGPSYDNMKVATDWTYYQSIQASVDLLVDASGIATLVGLPDNAEFGATLAWRTTRVGLRGSSPINAIDSGEITVSTLIPIGEAGGSLTLEAKIVLLSPGIGDRDELAPTEVGSVLWTDEWPVVLEGIAARLPIIPVSMGQHPFYGLHNARWLVKVEMADLEAPIDAAVRVFVNESNENVQRMMSEPGGETANAMTSSLLIDIQRELMRLALAEDSAYEHERDYPDGSLGDALSASLQLFPKDFELLQNIAQYDGASFDVELQGRLGEERVNG